MFLFCLVFAMSLCTSVYMCFVVTCWKRADLLALVCGVYCEFVTFPLVSRVRCGTWLYRFLIFAPLLTCCWLLLPLWDSVIVLCFVVGYFVSILVLQSSRWGRESWLLCFVCLPGACGCCVALPHNATGLSAVCDCGISLSYSLFLGCPVTNFEGKRTEK